LINPILFPSRKGYLKKYCNPQYIKGEWCFEGLTNWQELRNLLQTVMIRRKKKDVLKDLPEKNIIIQNMPLCVNEKEDLEKGMDEFKSWIRCNHKASELEIKTHIDHIKQLAYKAKEKSVYSWIENFLQSGEKLVVVAYHTKAIDDLVNYFKCDKIDGSVSMSKRQEIIDRFQTDKSVQLLVGQITAMGVGITLTAASNMVIVEFGWTPADHDQVIDRLHRIGQLNSVNAYYLVGLGTVEENILFLLQHKASMINKLIDGDEKTKHFDSDILYDLIKEYREDNKIELREKDEERKD
jgi:SWI/SNF-related matrix-associated actin-dependent regulator 1 of chromatin subfamily A